MRSQPRKESKPAPRKTRSDNEQPDVPGVELIPVDFDPFKGEEILRTVPLTEPQQEIWISAQMGAEASCAFNESLSIRLRGTLDADAMIKSLQALVRRHEALRCTFAPEEASACISAAVDLSAPVLDFAGLSRHTAEERFLEATREDLARPFDLVKGPLFRARIFRLAEREHILSLTAHHIICDGWSIDVLLKDLSVMYSAALRGEEHGLKEPSQYSAYALLMQRECQGPESASAEQYWLTQFQAEVPDLDLPADFPRPKLRTYKCAREDLDTEPSLLADLRRIGTRMGSSLFTVLLSGYMILLHRLSGQGELVTGVPAAGQPVAGLPDLVGHCVNFLPVRSSHDGDRKFSEYLRSVSSTLMDAYDHQVFSYGSLLKRLPLRRDPGRIPLVAVSFTHSQEFEEGQIKFEGLESEYFLNPRGFETFELNMNAREAGGRLEMKCHYNTSLFRAETIRRWLREYETLLRAIAADPEKGIGELEMLPEEEKGRLEAWNATEAEYPREALAQELFEAQAARTPDRVAVECEGKRLSYGELEGRSNRLARYLRKLGAGAGGLVGLYMDRSVEMVVGLLGILKSGAAYVPLDPSFPRERVGYMLEDSGLKLVVTRGSLVSELPGAGVRAVRVEEEWEAIGAEEGSRPESGAKSGDRAYMIYTSGSTGKPKGVEVLHRGVVNFLCSMMREPGVKETEVMLAVTTLSFDIAVLEVLLPLCVGAKTVVVGRETALSGKALAEALGASGATMMQATPATWRMLLEASYRGGAGFKALCGGEAMPLDLARGLLSVSKDVWNMYGPTETTVWSTCCRVQEGAEAVSIGRPIANTKVYILDRWKRRVPIGVVGDLYIGGEGVARGYHERPELTGQRFVEDPFAGGGARMYFTGDLARYLGNGEIQFLGRSDYQVKIRGYRVELGEIESVLRGHPSVAECVVMAREDTPGDVRLVAYLIPASGFQPDLKELRSFASKEIPLHMVPSVFLFLQEYPMTPNGKVDRKRLPPPGDTRPQLAGQAVPPNTEMEKTVATVWRKYLGVKTVGIHDNFFDLGGHSLLLAQVHAELRKVTGRDILILDMFQHPTVHAIARRLVQGEASSLSQDTMAERAKKQRDAVARNRLKREKRE